MDEQQPSLSSWSLDPDKMAGGDSLLSQPEGQDEFAKYLDFDFDFTALDNLDPNAGNNGQLGTGPSTTMMQDVQLTAVDQLHTSHADQQPAPPPTHTHQQQPSIYSTPNFAQTQSTDIQPGNAVQQPRPGSQFYFQNQSYGQRQSFIPPTPNSMEMQPASTGYPVPLDTGRTQRGYEAYHQSADDQSAFTPLISPAMTPLDQQYRLPEYTVPGEYLTPLTSPALEGHNPNSGFYYSNTQNDSTFTPSTIDVPSSHASGSAGPSSPGIVKKQRRKQPTQSRTTTRVRQSPSVRPQTGRQRNKTLIESQIGESASSAISQNPANGAPLSNHLRSAEGSSQDSVSPEPLSEPLMPPPALPRPGKSPSAPGQESNQAHTSTTAATPASLMKLQKQQQQQQPQQQHCHVQQKSTPQSANVAFGNAPDEPMEDISLPEPASGPLHPAPVRGDLTPVPTPSDRPGTSSVGPSPQISAMQSPTGPAGMKRTDTKSSTRTGAGSSTKRRQHTSSTQASPALRPKISPNLKPLASSGSEGMTAETSALYLASKSNYQHILEGTVPLGVSYPESLAENLSSKRTNHKLAEQGRRNRMNSAVKEMEALLPSSLTQEKSNKDKERKDSVDDSNAATGANGTSKSPEKSSSSSQPTSKASTIEMAIVYIKALQQELVQTKARLKDAEEKLEDRNCDEATEKTGTSTDKDEKVDASETADSQSKSNDQNGETGTATVSAEK